MISALCSTKGPDKHSSLHRMGANIAAGMRAEGVRRIVWCASEGIDGEIPGLVGALVMRLLARPLADHRAALAEFDGGRSISRASV
ncbi:MAG: SDR family oxidoreductase, partial [Nocardioides sp.]|nr:SDR family oxidoreductase [Nocardioides sp.]